MIWNMTLTLKKQKKNRYQINKISNKWRKRRYKMNDQKYKGKKLEKEENIKMTIRYIKKKNWKKRKARNEWSIIYKNNNWRRKQKQ